MTAPLEFGLDTLATLRETQAARHFRTPKCSATWWTRRCSPTNWASTSSGWGSITAQAEADHGSLYVGSPETVARKIAATARALGLARFHLKYSAGPSPHERLMRSIGLYGTKVVPMVRDLLAA